MDAFKNKYIQTCQQQNTHPNDAILHAIRESNKRCKSQEGTFILNLAGCNLSPTDSNVLSKCFATDNYIEQYHFTDCLLSEESCKIILNAFTFNKTLKILDLKGNNLRASGAELVGKLLKRTSITELFLEWNSLGMWDTGLTAIAEGLALNTTLRVLDLSNNQISHHGGEEIANALKRNKQLRVLDLRWNNIGMAGGRAFLNAMTHNKYVVSLELAGNNIPSDTMKAIATSVKRNVDYHSIYEEHHAKTQSMRQEIDQLQLEKSMQVSTLIDQLEREKELQENVSQSARDRMEHMRAAIEDLKSENRKLKECFDSQSDELKASESVMKELSTKLENTRKEGKLREETMVSERLAVVEENTREKAQYQAELLRRVEDIQTITKEKKDMSVRLEVALDEVARLKESLKKSEERFLEDKRVLSDRCHQDKEELRHQHEHLMKNADQKILRISSDNERLIEEVTRLKSNILTDKLRFEEESLSQRAKWKQEEIAKSKQYEDRIDLLLRGKDDLQAKLSKVSVELAETHTQLTSSQKDHEASKRQCEHLQQLMSQRDLEYRNENNRVKLEVDSERRVNAELKDKVASQDIKIQEIRSQMKDMQSEKEAEKTRLQDLLRAKEDEMKRTREEELRRAGMLETALQSYISSTRSAYK